MFAEKMAKKLLNQEDFNKIKVAYRNFRRQIHPKISERKFRKILKNDLGIRDGSVVFIHSSIDNLYLNFRVDKVLNLLLETVGEEGTILFPCNQLLERAEDYLNRNEIFDVKRTLSKMGLLPGFAMRHKNAFRSLHPTNSVVAIGKYAKELTYEHQDSIYPCGEKSPYYKIIHYNGIIVGLGVTTESLTFTHTVEDIMKENFPLQTRMNKIFDAKVKDKDGNEFIVKTLVHHPNTGLRNIHRFMKKYIPSNVCKNFRIKGIPFFKADANLLLDKMTKLAENKITIYNQ
jgi:aminoglycoside 3-N-acetyltransferase